MEAREKFEALPRIVSERDKIKVVDCRDFGRDSDNLCILLSDYENIECARYDSQLEKLIRNKSFSFDESKHEYWELE